jgi:hypothetical protein
MTSLVPPTPTAPARTAPVLDVLRQPDDEERVAREAFERFDVDK